MHEYFVSSFMGVIIFFSYVQHAMQNELEKMKEAD